MAVNIDAIDQVARDGVHSVGAKIETHEQVCEANAREAKTWRSNTDDKLNRIEASLNKRIDAQDKMISGAYNRMWASAIGLLLTLLAVIGYLIAHHGL